VAEIKSTESAAAKWARRAGNAGAEYEDGIKNPKRDWQQATMAAEDSYKKGVVEAANAGRFGNGVRAAGSAKWQGNAIAKGPARYSQGVQLAENAYAEGFRPYAEVIRSLNLPKRGPKGDPNNIQRVAAISTALHQKKISLKGGK
jgi:hypothetical protein